MSRLPLRIRLTAIFAAVMALVLTGAGWITLARFSESQHEYGPPARTPAQHEALGDLRRELLIALPIVFVLATAAAYLLATAALRPVEEMRAQAAAVTEDTPSLRLDIPPSRDEIARLATTLNDMLDRLQAALERERHFVADAGHELRTPLSLLHTEIELALRHPRDASELRTALASAHQEARRLVRLTEDLLLLARTDRHTSTPTGAGNNTPVAPALHHLAARLDPVGTQITIECPSALAVTADEDRLDRAVTNLLLNAIQHGKPPIEITAHATSGLVEIHVRDHGIGFPPAFLPHAFNRFTQADQARTGTGTGLGLAITAAIARTAGGTYGARNHPSGGADVWLALPPGTKPAD
jgi:signal transduction histidine kinase